MTLHAVMRHHSLIALRLLVSAYRSVLPACQVCDDWFARMRPLLISACQQAGRPQALVYHASLRLQALAGEWTAAQRVFKVAQNTTVEEAKPVSVHGESDKEAAGAEVVALQHATGHQSLEGSASNAGAVQGPGRRGRRRTAQPAQPQDAPTPKLLLPGGKLQGAQADRTPPGEHASASKDKQTGVQGQSVAMDVGADTTRRLRHAVMTTVVQLAGELT